MKRKQHRYSIELELDYTEYIYCGYLLGPYIPSTW